MRSIIGSILTVLFALVLSMGLSRLHQGFVDEAGLLIAAGWVLAIVGALGVLYGGVMWAAYLVDSFRTRVAGRHMSFYRAHMRRNRMKGGHGALGHGHGMPEGATKEHGSIHKHQVSDDSPGEDAGEASEIPAEAENN